MGPFKHKLLTQIYVLRVDPLDSALLRLVMNDGGVRTRSGDCREAQAAVQILRPPKIRQS